MVLNASHDSHTVCTICHSSSTVQDVRNVQAVMSWSWIQPGFIRPSWSNAIPDMPMLDVRVVLALQEAGLGLVTGMFQTNGRR